MLFIVWGNRAPRMLHFRLTEEGIEVEGGRFHSLKDFESASINTLGTGWAEFVLTFHAKLKTPLKVLFPESRLSELRNDIKTLVREVPYEPTLIDSIEKLLRF